MRTMFSPSSTILRITLLLVAALLNGSTSAQLVNLSLAVGLSRTLETTLSAGVTLNNILLVQGYALEARVMADIGEGGALDLSALLKIPLDTWSESERLDLYAGSGIVLGFGSPVRLRPSLTTGLIYGSGGQTQLFGEGTYQLQGQFRVRVGILYSF